MLEMKAENSFLYRIAVEPLPFRPALGLSSPHIQTILPTLFNRKGGEPPYKIFFVELKDGDVLYCKMSTPPNWKSSDKTMIMLPGLGGSDSSTYMIRMCRKFYQAGYRCLRVNLRGAGQGIHFARRPYHGGISGDILEVVQLLNKQTPHSPLVLIGFSLGGNILLKLLGELREKALDLVDSVISICAPIDLARTLELLMSRSNRFYHQYYVSELRKIGSRWIGNLPIRSLLDFDNLVTAPHWGYRDAFDYYQQCSSKFLLSHICQTCHLIFTADDPFVDYRSVLEHSHSSKMKIWLSENGGHMGFWGWAGKEHGYNWLDNLLLKLVNEVSHQ